MRGLFVVEGSILRINVPYEGEALRVDAKIIRIKRHEMLNKSRASRLTLRQPRLCSVAHSFCGGESLLWASQIGDLVVLASRYVGKRKFEGKPTRSRKIHVSAKHTTFQAVFRIHAGIKQFYQTWMPLQGCGKGFVVFVFSWAFRVLFV